MKRRHQHTQVSVAQQHKGGTEKRHPQRTRSSPASSAAALACGGSVVVLVVLGALWGLHGSSGGGSTSSMESILRSHPPLGPTVAQWYSEHAAWLASHPAAAAGMRQRLHQRRQELGGAITLQHAAAALQGSRLPRGTTLQQARQLLIDVQLLADSLGNSSSSGGGDDDHGGGSGGDNDGSSSGGAHAPAGFAAARVAAMRRHYGLDAGDYAAPGAGDAAAGVGGSGGHTQQQQQQQQGHAPQQERGILIVGGSRTHLGNAYLLLRMLREHLGCALPVEVVYYGPQELDPLAAGQVAAFAASQAAAGAAPIRLIDGAAVHARRLPPLAPHPAPALTSWVAKVHALCWVTSFRHVLLLDSDNLPTQDPAPLFGAPAYERHGALAWPDFWRSLWMEPALHHLLGLAVPWEEEQQQEEQQGQQQGQGQQQEQQEEQQGRDNGRGAAVSPGAGAGGYLAAESGQLLLDRARHADVLEWLWLLNAHAGLVYRALVGDKDTYRLAFLLAGKGQHYWQVPQPPQQLLFDAGPTAAGRRRFVHLGMGQASPDGAALLFLHRTARGKYFPWCAASRQLRARGGRGGCSPAWLSLPVVQEQLLASVPDPGSMVYDDGALDTTWHEAACEAPHGIGSSSSSGGGGGECGGQWAMPLPACVRGFDAAQLPIRAVPVAAVPGLAAYLEVAQRVFEQAAAQLPVRWPDRIKVLLGKL